jgi:sulfonate transport system ATP-binding protein
MTMDLEPVNLGGRLDLRGVGKLFPGPGGGLEALRDISLTIAPGEFISIVGGSGCGKSTLLRLIAGLEQPSSGSVALDGRAITAPGRDRGLVFQDHRLLPWQTVRENVAFAMAAPGASEARRSVAEHIELVGLGGFEDTYPAQLSGGMAQRAAIARALVNRPRVLLLDEPFASLDALTRIQLQQEILRIWQRERTTVVLVTHDIDEALFLGDRVLVLSPRPGSIRRLVQVPLPRPRQRGGAGFLELRQQIYREFFADEEVLMDYVV